MSGIMAVNSEVLRISKESFMV